MKTYKWADCDIEMIYQAYPRHVGKRAALGKIRKALDIFRSDAGPSFTEGNAVSWLYNRVTAFARSPAGQAGHYTPYPATWFNQGRYDDDPRTWQEVPAKETHELTADEIRRQMEGQEAS